MPGPGRGFPGRGRGGFRPGWGPRLGPRRGLGPLGFVGAVATGAAVAAVVGAPPRRRYPPPRPGYIYVVPARGQPPRAVRAEESSFIIGRVMLASYQQGTSGEVLFEVQVTMNDGYKYSVMRRYSQFDQLRERVARLLRAVTPPFPSKHGVRSAFVGLRPEDLEQRRAMLQAWLQSLCTSASLNNPALRLPLYDFLETAAYYPPEDPAPAATAGSTSSPATTTATVATPVATASDAIHYATATPYTAPVETAGTAYPPLPPPQAPKPDPAEYDGWAVPPESREASDMQLAMTGPDSSGRLPAAKAAQALREGTGAGSDDLRTVWELSDIDKDGMLDREEFAVAWYLGKRAAAGIKPPPSLPADIVPPSKRSAAPPSSANPF